MRALGKHGWWAAVSLSMMLVSGAEAQFLDENVRLPKGSLPEAVAGEFIVKFRESGVRSFSLETISKNRNQKAARSLAQSLNRWAGESVFTEALPLVTDPSVVKVTVRGNQSMRLAEILKSGDEIEYYEPNFIYRTLVEGSDAVPNDPDFSKLWGMHNTGQTDSAGQIGVAGTDINVLPLWNRGVTGSDDLLVAVIDTGIDFNHPDLRDNVYINEGESGSRASNGLDDDGNGFVDDVYGYDFFNKKANGLDDQNHGSHCAGTIGGTGNNTMGVVGVNWRVKMLPVKFLSAQGSGSLEGAIEAINYARKMKVKIMSNSWGGGGFSNALKDAISGAESEGILFVAAAGNEKSDNDKMPTYPASYQLSNVVAVAAVDNRGVLASFSNWGQNTVHVAAPGVKVYSTIRDGKYASYNGTSMACPHVAGVAALIWGQNPNWNFVEVKRRLIETSQPIQGLKRKVVSKGMVSATNAFDGVIPPSLDPDESLWRDVTGLPVMESEHPYVNKVNQTIPISVPGAKYLRVLFEQIDVESSYDFVTVENSQGVVFEKLTGTHLNYQTEYFETDSLVIRLKADDSFTKWGFKVAKVQVIFQ